LPSFTMICSQPATTPFPYTTLFRSSLKERLLEEGWLTVKQVSARLGIDRGTINKRRLQGQIKALLCNDHGQWLYWLPDPVTSLRSEEHTSELQSRFDLVCRLLLEKK